MPGEVNIMSCIFTLIDRLLLALSYARCVGPRLADTATTGAMSAHPAEPSSEGGSYCVLFSHIMCHTVISYCAILCFVMYEPPVCKVILHFDFVMLKVICYVKYHIPS